MDELSAIGGVLRRYPAIQPVERIESLGGAGGFSGAALWRLESRLGALCLRRWPPEHPDESRLQFIHEVLLRASRRGIAELPAPLADIDHRTFVRRDGALWELTPWMPGNADYRDDPRPEKLQNALRWLARFHLAAAPARADVRPSPGIAERIELLERLKSGEVEEIQARLGARGWPEFASRAVRVLAAFREHVGRVEYQLRIAAAIEAPLQPCIRDVHRDHILFEEDRVAGVVDFGAMRNECVAADIARLLGSLAGNEQDAWKIGFAAYEAARPLDDAERRLVRVCDESGVLLSGMNWLRWILLERRTFPEPGRIVERLDEILGRLEAPPRRDVD